MFKFGQQPRDKNPKPAWQSLAIAVCYTLEFGIRQTLLGIKATGSIY